MITNVLYVELVPKKQTTPNEIFIERDVKITPSIHLQNR